MADGGLGGWPLRLRVALAFFVATAVALVGLGAFVLVRVEQALDERLRDTLEGQMDALVRTPAAQRGRVIASLTGETYGQVLDETGSIVASSPLVPGRLLPAGTGEGYVEADASVLDDEAGGTSAADRGKTEPALLLVHRVDRQVLVLGTSRDDTGETVRKVREQLLVGGPLALAIAGILGYVIAGLGLRPIDRMRAHADTISVRSSGERLPLPAARDELRRLAETLNDMLDRLDQGLQRERRFVADASHELRTPLSLMLTEVELALSRPRTREELTAALRSTEEETRRLIALAESLLLLASADADRLPLDLRPLDLSALIRDVASRFSNGARAAGRELTVTAPERADVFGDPHRLEQVVANLLDNCLRHGAGDIEVIVDADDDRVTLLVADHGPGFLEERPLDRFTGSGTSTGLGLAIADELVRAHGGVMALGREEGRTIVRAHLPGLGVATHPR